MPNRAGRRSRGKASKGSVDAGKMHFVKSNESGSTQIVVKSADDLTRRPMAPDLARLHIPKNLLTQIHWLSTSIEFNQTITSGAITEKNFSFSLGDLPLAGQIAALFDQYAIFAVYVRVITNVANLSAGASPTYTTAIDYDNVSNLSSVPQVKSFSTSLTTPISEIQSRYIEPCNAPALYSGSAFTNYGQSRMWCDNVNNGTPHYGFRFILPSLGAGATGTVVFECTYVVCARNVV